MPIDKLHSDPGLQNSRSLLSHLDDQTIALEDETLALAFRDCFLSIFKRVELHKACTFRLALVILEDIGFPHIEILAGKSFGELSLSCLKAQVSNVYREVVVAVAVLFTSLVLWAERILRSEIVTWPTK